MEIKKEIYPNQPLVEVVFEIRFPGEPIIECKRGEFYDKIRENYPNVLVPQLKAGAFPALVPYRFERSDGAAGTMVAIDKFSYYSRKYPGYDNFKKEFFQLLSEFNKLCNLNKLNRVGWRYVNIIPFTRENGNIPFKRFLNSDLRLTKDIQDGYENLSLMLVSKTGDCSITTILESTKSSDATREALLLDFDCSREKDLCFPKIETYIDESHGTARTMFEQMITDDYRKYLRGELKI